MAVVASSLKKEILEDKTIVTDYIHPHSLNNGIPTAQISNPKLGGDFSVDDAVLKGNDSMKAAWEIHVWIALLTKGLTEIALPIPGTRLTKAYRYGSSLWGLTAKLVTQLPDGSAKSYFLKVATSQQA
jgi:protein-ribulosamine 3-kinase